MSYNIYHSNSLPEFVTRYSDLFHQSDLFGEQVITVVQNSNIGTWLKLELTKTDGISMDLKMEYPENAVKQLVFGYKSGRELFELGDDTKSLLFMDSLKIVLFKTLEELLVDDSLYENLYNYVQGSSQRLFQLSDSIAGLFYHYGMNCPQMVSSWDRSELYKSSDGIIRRVEDQKWQMSLWNRVFNSKTPYLHISKVLNKVLESSDEYEPEFSPFGKCRIILFGSSFLGESAIKFFNYISKDIDVHHFILTPSIIYSKDEYEEPLSLLNRFSGLINGFTSISREPTFSKTRFSFFEDKPTENLLHNLQKGIKDNSLVEQNRQELIPVKNGDNSLKICKVTGGWREIEILKDKILKLLDSDPGLKLTEIGVVAPEITEYSTYIEGVFSDVKQLEDGTPIFGKQHLPYNIMGLKGGEESPYIRGMLSLLELPGSDFNRKVILNLISNPCFMEKFSINNSCRDLYTQSIKSLNIKWGLDGKHRADLGYDSDDFNTWENGFKRYLLGLALNREDSNLNPFNLNDTQSSELLGNLVHILRSLYSDLSGLNSMKLYMDEWVMFIETIMETYLKPVKNDLFDERERLSVKHQYRNILNLLDDLKQLENFKNREIPFPLFRSLLKEFIIKASNSKGRYLTQGITFSSLKPLRAVPFKHIFVLGLNEEVFPGKEKVPSYDLRGIYDQKIDLSKRQNDKFAFLELLLSAKDSLTLFYSARNQVTGEDLQPSVVINELLEAIESNFEHVDLIESHPLHNFDPIYFYKDSNLFSYNKRAYESALAYRGLKTRPITLDLDEDRVTEGDLEININDLISFLKNPVKNFFTKSEGLYLDNSESIEDDLYENRDLEFLSKWKLANLVIETGLNGDIPMDDLCNSFFKAAGLEGVFKDDKLTSNVRESIKELIEDVDNFLVEQNLKSSDYKRVNRELKGEFNPISYSIDGRTVSITGELENLWIDCNKNCFTTKVNLGSGKEMKTRDKIQPFIYSLIMAAHPDMYETGLKAYSIGKGNIPPVGFFDITDSEERLKGIIKLYIKNSVKPIPIFPDIIGEPDVKAVQKAWRLKQNDGFNFSEIAECPYVNMAYGNTAPEFTKEDIDTIYNAVYSDLIVKKSSKK